MRLFVFKVFHGLAPDDLSELIQFLDVRSSDWLLVDVSCFRVVIKGDCTFALVVPKQGNNLSLTIKCVLLVNIFKIWIKTPFFFGLLFAINDLVI